MIGTSLTEVFKEYEGKKLKYTQVIEYLSRLAWKINESSYQMQLLKAGEETITDLLLMEMGLLQERTIIRKFNKQKEEPKKGADWEWWIKVGDKVIGFRIQAKILSYDGKGIAVYNDIGRKIGGRSSKSSRLKGIYQIDQLIKQARNGRKGVKLIPIYSFYNYFNQDYYEGSINKDYGWTYAYAEVIRNILEKPGSKGNYIRNCEFEKLQPYSRPMKHLLSLSDILKDSLKNYNEALISASLRNEHNLSKEKDYVVKMPSEVEELFNLLSQKRPNSSKTRLIDLCLPLSDPPYKLDYIVVTEIETDNI